MTRAYVLDPVTRATLGLVDQSWEHLSYVRRYTAMDTFELVINRSRLWASELSLGRLLYLPDEGDLVFLIEQIASTAEGSTRNDEMTVTGRSLEGIALAERLVTPLPGDAYDRQTDVAAETAMKHLVRAHAADLAAVARQVPGLIVAPDAARGPTMTVNGRYQAVLDLVREVGLLAGLGWEITYDPATDVFVFDVVEGVDRTASVFFDFAFDTLERTDELDSVIDAVTVAVVAGQGEGVDRDVVTRFAGAEPAAFDRREAFLDARDVELGDTTVLAQRGDAFLAASGAETSVEATIHAYGGFRYREHWDVGDVVTVRNAERAISYAARIVEVTKAFERSAAAPTITATLGRPFPSLASVTAGSTARTADSGGGASLSGPAGGVLSGTYPDPGFAVDMATQAELDAAVAAVLPPGMIVAYGGSAAPTGWLVCDGSSLARAGTYANLFAAIGTAYGTVDGSHFNIPDLRGRFPLGRASAGTGSSLGATGGLLDHAHTSTAHTHGITATHTHTGPSHTHSTPAHDHTLSAHTHTGPSHTHTSAAHSHSHNHQTTMDSSGTATSWKQQQWGSGSSTSMNRYVNTTSASSTMHYENTDTDATSTTPGATGSGGTAATGAPSIDLTDTSGGGTSGSGGSGATGATAPGTSDSTTPGATGSGNPPFQVVNYLIKI